MGMVEQFSRIVQVEMACLGRRLTGCCERNLIPILGAGDVQIGISRRARSSSKDTRSEREEDWEYREKERDTVVWVSLSLIESVSQSVSYLAAAKRLGRAIPQQAIPIKETRAYRFFEKLRRCWECKNNFDKNTKKNVTNANLIGIIFFSSGRTTSQEKKTNFVAGIWRTADGVKNNSNGKKIERECSFDFFNGSRVCYFIQCLLRRFHRSRITNRSTTRT